MPTTTRSIRRFAELVTRFDLRALFAITVGCAALFAVGRFDARFAMLLAGPLGVVWLVCILSTGADPGRRVRGLLVAVVGALAGSFLAMGIQIVIWGFTPLNSLLSATLSSLGTLAGAALGMGNRRVRRRILAGAASVLGLLITAFGILAVYHWDEIWASRQVGVGLNYRIRSPVSSRSEDPAFFIVLRQLLGLSYTSEFIMTCDADGSLGKLARHAKGLRNLEYLWIDGLKRDENLAAVSQLSTLRYLRLKNAELDDEGTRHLAKLRNLEHIDFHGRITGGLEHLAAIPTLRGLSIVSSDEISPEALAALRNTPINYLMLGSVPIRSEHIAALEQLKGLRVVEVYSGTMSPTSLRQLGNYSGSIRFIPPLPPGPR